MPWMTAAGMAADEITGGDAGPAQSGAGDNFASVDFGPMDFGASTGGGSSEDTGGTVSVPGYVMLGGIVVFALGVWAVMR